jgi:hypothetical protein
MGDSLALDQPREIVDGSEDIGPGDRAATITNHQP